MSSIDWSGLARMGMAQLRLRPDEFWRLTPVEFLILAGRADAPASTTRDALERLLQTFPDRRASR